VFLLQLTEHGLFLNVLYHRSARLPSIVCRMSPHEMMALAEYSVYRVRRKPTRETLPTRRPC
jgi:hypothetical protein